MSSPTQTVPHSLASRERRFYPRVAPQSPLFVAFGETCDTVPARELAYVLGELDNFSGKVLPERQRKASWNPIFHQTRTDFPIDGIDPYVTDFHQDVACRNIGTGHRFNLEFV